MALRCACVIRGGRKPLVVLFISSSDDALGAIVPIPAAPVVGNVFCACTQLAVNAAAKSSVNIFFMVYIFVGLRFFKQAMFKKFCKVFSIIKSYNKPTHNSYARQSGENGIF